MFNVSVPYLEATLLATIGRTSVRQIRSANPTPTFLVTLSPVSTSAQTAARQLLKSAHAVLSRVRVLARGGYRRPVDIGSPGCEDRDVIGSIFLCHDTAQGRNLLGCDIFRRLQEERSRILDRK